MKNPKELSVQPPTEGVRYELGSNYLSNIKEGKPHPRPVEFYLFIDRIAPKVQRHFVWTISAPTEEEAVILLEDFASRPDVVLIEESTNRVINKEWMKPDQEQTVGG